MPIPQGGEYDITVYQGAVFRETFEVLEPDGVTPTPLTGYTGASQIRKKPGSEELIAEFLVEVDPAVGKVTISLTDEQTAEIGKGTYVYDLFLTTGSGDADEPLMLVGGEVTIKPRVTVL